MAPGLYLGAWIAFLLLAFHLPAHLALRKWFTQSRTIAVPTRWQAQHEGRRANAKPVSGMDATPCRSAVYMLWKVGIVLA